jgi:hypothetical protein
VVCSGVFLTTLVALCKRKDYQPLKSRGLMLNFLSTLANFCVFLCTMLDMIISNPTWHFWKNFQSTSSIFGEEETSIVYLSEGSTLPPGIRVAIGTTCFFEYLNWKFFRVVWLMPYLFRILKLYQIWNFHKIFIKVEDEVIIESQGNELNESQVISEQHNRIEDYNRKRKCQTYFIHERNIVFWFFISMLPFLIFAITELFYVNSDKFIPTFCIKACC